MALIAPRVLILKLSRKSWSFVIFKGLKFIEPTQYAKPIISLPISAIF